MILDKAVANQHDVSERTNYIVEMKTTVSHINTCADEISSILLCWMYRIKDCLDESERDAFDRVLSQQRLALNKPGANIKLTHRKWDKFTGELKQHIPDIVLRFLSMAELSDLGIYGYAIASTNTLREALELSNNVHFLTAERQTQELSTRGREAILYPRLLMSTGNYADIAEDTLAGSWRLLKLLIGRRFHVEDAMVRFSYAAPSYRSSHDAVFDRRCTFEQQNTEIGFPKAWLDFSVVPTVHGRNGILTSGFVEGVLGRKIVESGDVVSAVKRLLISRLNRCFPLLEDAADELDLSVSQLRHRLYNANTSYKRVVLDIRMTLAVHYLKRTDFDIQKIAFLLDYSEAAAFSRSFKKSIGVSPQYWRDAVT